jgi:hypothetical protein
VLESLKKLVTLTFYYGAFGHPISSIFFVGDKSSSYQKKSNRSISLECPVALMDVFNCGGNAVRDKSIGIYGFDHDLYDYYLITDERRSFKVKYRERQWRVFELLSDDYSQEASNSLDIAIISKCFVKVNIPVFI